jgi:nucleoside 2-deoxyribosyltransferase
MPFAESFAPVFFELIAPAAAGANLVVMRTDQEPTLVSIDQRIRSGIRMADLVVADVTTYNPNVFYELGVAHAHGKWTLLLREAGVTSMVPSF